MYTKNTNTMGKVKELMYGDRIDTVGQLRLIMSDLDDSDQLTLVTCDEHGDEQDHYPMAIDVIGNIRLTDDTIVREVQFVQRPNSEPDTRDKQPVVDALIDVLAEDIAKGDTTVLDELLLRMPFDVLKYALPEDMWADFEDKENVRDGVTLIPSQCPFAIAGFKVKWGQGHQDICEHLGYDPEDSDELLMEDYFWLPNEKQWYPKGSSLFSIEEQKVAYWLKP